MSMKLKYFYCIVCKENVFSIIKSLATVVEGDPKAPLSIATTPRCREGHYSIPWIAHFTLNTYLTLLSVKQGGIKYHF